MFVLEVDFGVVVAGGEQLFHLFHRRDTRVGAGAGIRDRIDSDVVQTGLEYLFRYKAVFGAA